MEVTNNKNLNFCPIKAFYFSEERIFSLISIPVKVNYDQGESP